MAGSSRNQKVPRNLIDVLDNMIDDCKVKTNVKPKRTDVLKVIGEELKSGKFNIVPMNRNKRRRRAGFMLSNKRGQVVELLLVGVILLAIGLTILVSSKAFTGIFEAYNETNSVSNQSREFITKQHNNFDNMFNSIFAFITIGFIISGILLAWFIRIPAPFYIIGLFLIIVLVIVNASISNVYVDLASDPVISDEADKFSLMEFFLSNLHFLLIGMAGIVLVIQSLRRGADLG